ncbi:hypothetical protein DFH09DRAFT_1069414 [Mycena vulgaris]|nr:hypothetical protein DFH09DRAFT_1069414 [Mycena vulgaris]
MRFLGIVATANSSEPHNIPSSAAGESEVGDQIRACRGKERLLPIDGTLKSRKLIAAIKKKSSVTRDSRFERNYMVHVFPPSGFVYPRRHRSRHTFTVFSRFGTLGTSRADEKQYHQSLFMMRFQIERTRTWASGHYRYEMRQQQENAPWTAARPKCAQQDGGRLVEPYVHERPRRVATNREGCRCDVPLSFLFLHRGASALLVWEIKGSDNPMWSSLVISSLKSPLIEGASNRKMMSPRGQRIVSTSQSSAMRHAKRKKYKTHGRIIDSTILQRQRNHNHSQSPNPLTCHPILISATEGQSLDRAECLAVQALGYCSLACDIYPGANGTEPKESFWTAEAAKSRGEESLEILGNRLKASVIKHQLFQARTAFSPALVAD